MDEETEERLQRRAYEIWESEGRPAGRAAEHWDAACREFGVRDPAEPPTEAGDPQI